MEEIELLPTGWRRVREDSGRYHYLTRQPQVKIVKKSQLESFHLYGRYLEMSTASLDFGTKTRGKKFSVVKDLEGQRVPVPGDVVEGFEMRYQGVEGVGMIPEGLPTEKTVEDMEGEEVVKDVHIPEESGIKQTKLEREQLRIEKAVKNLTLDSNHQVDHKSDLKNCAKLLNGVRTGFNHLNVETNLDDLKSQIKASESVDEVLNTCRSFPEIRIKMSDLEQSKILEQFLRLSSIPDIDNPLTDFPADVNTNHYVKIITFAAENAPDALRLLLKLSIKNEAPVTEQDVIRLAYLFSSVAGRQAVAGIML